MLKRGAVHGNLREIKYLHQFRIAKIDAKNQDLFPSHCISNDSYKI